jgi:hypothetical protein
MENTDNKQLSFPQRNWFLICVVVAILSPLVVHFLQASAQKQSYKQSIDIRSADSSKALDTSYKVASPPDHTQKKNKADSGSGGKR